MSLDRILVLEDDADLRELMREILTDSGYVVETAASGAEALATAQRVPLDLLVADIFLPDLSGIDVLRQLRTLQPELPGIAITGHTNGQVSIDAVRAGFTGFMVKPVTAEELVSAVAGALEQEHLRRENARLRALVPLYELSRAFMGTTALSQVLNQIVTTAREETGAEVVSLMLVEQNGRELSIAAASGLDQEIVESQRRSMGSGIAGWVAEHGEPLMIAEGVPMDEQIRKSMGKPEVLSALSLPLAARGEIIGVLNLSRLRGAEPFTRGDLELASVLAGQAAIAIDKARLIDDLSMLTETSQQLASALDLSDAASIIVEAAARVCHAQRGVFWLMEQVSGQLTLFKAFAFPDEELRRLTAPPPGMLIPPEHFLVREGTGVLWLPITRGDSRFGLIELHLPSAERPRPDRVGLLRTIAHTAASVIESHRLRAREAIAFRELDSTLRANLDLRQALERVLSQMIEACGAQGGGIFLTAEEGAPFEAWVNSGIEPPAPLARQVASANQPMLISSLDDAKCPDCRSLIGTPMTIGGRVEGAVLLCHRKPAAFAARHLNLLSVLTSSAALIVRNAQLYARSEEAAIGEERTRIAREIHDGLAQDLSFLVLKVELMRDLLRKGKPHLLEREMEEMASALRNDVREVRRTIFALRPLDLEALGFLPALQKFVHGFASANDLQIELHCSGPVTKLTPKLQTALFRLTQETLNNVRKHARASNVSVDLELDDNCVSLIVRDDGRGFDPPRVLDDARDRGSVGMIQMRERAERAGGTFRLESTPGEGTRIQVRLPLR